jgi:5-(carboxyamino)imidazole ribonucleotide mutase
MTDRAEVGIVMGSESDRPTMNRCCEVLDSYGIGYEVAVKSAHRDPEGCREWATSAKDRGLKVLVAGAGGAAHLPGVVAAWSILPVIGVPMSAGALGGMDALLSMAQMPAGIPVATVAIGEAGARNAGHLAAEIIALARPEMVERILARRQKQRAPKQPETASVARS